MKERCRLSPEVAWGDRGSLLHSTWYALTGGCSNQNQLWLVKIEEHKVPLLWVTWKYRVRGNLKREKRRRLFFVPGTRSQRASKEGRKKALRLYAEQKNISRRASNPAGNIDQPRRICSLVYSLQRFALWMLIAVVSRNDMLPRLSPRQNSMMSAWVARTSFVFRLCTSSYGLYGISEQSGYGPESPLTKSRGCTHL